MLPPFTENFSSATATFTERAITFGTRNPKFWVQSAVYLADSDLGVVNRWGSTPVKMKHCARGRETANLAVFAAIWIKSCGTFSYFCFVYLR